MPGVSLTWTIMYTKALVRLVSPQYTDCHLRRNFGGRAEKHPSKSKGVAMAFVGNIAGWKMESKTLGPCTPKLYR